MSLPAIRPIIPGCQESLLRKRSFKGFDNLYSCSACELRKEASAPVAPSSGILNVMIAGEAPGPDEDKQGVGFVGRTGENLWKKMKKKKLYRELFHITNIDKCYPARSRKPNSEQIKICGRKFLENEIKQVKPILILAFGNTSLNYFSGRKSGIRDLSGSIVWNEEYRCWIVWSMHPSAALHNSDNEVFVDAGLKSFVKMLRTLDYNKKFLKQVIIK